jgi:hypothetical protein
MTGKPATHFKFETQHKALARSDAFLFTLVDLELTREWINHFLPYWYSMARPILLLDDFKDLEDDRRTNDENTIIELGNNGAAIKTAYELGVRDSELLAHLNSKLATQMKRFLEEGLQYEHIQRELL